MRPNCTRLPATAVLAFLLLSPRLALPEGVAAVRTSFADPPRQYSSGPLWVWNDLLTDEQIRFTLQDLAGQRVRQVWVHPRPGLMTPYLSQEWFRLWKVALGEAARLDMSIWIYDENSYPSGFAGGLVPETMPGARGRGLHFREEERPGGQGPTATTDEDVAAVFSLSGDKYEDVTARARSGADLPAGRYLVASTRLAPSSGWFGGTWYVDLLAPGVTERFLDITLGAYERELKSDLGGRIPGVFTDEPHLCPAGGLHMGPHVLEAFRARWGYGLEEHLPALVRPLGDWRRVRHNYYQTLLEQFIERWAKPYYERCEADGLELTGHYWEHGWPDASHGPDNMAMSAWQQRPGIDNLMNQYGEGVHGQFGNSRTVRELASVANQLGRKRTLCETYGAGGWDLRFEDMKRIGDWLYALGVNTLNEHLSYVTLRGARKQDHPQSFSYHEPWWEDYHLMAGYFTRLSLALSAGEQVNRVLVLEPTTTAWLYQNDPTHRERLDRIGDSFQALVVALEAAQVEYDIGCEDIIARHGATEAARLVVGRRQYDTVVLAPETESLNQRTMELLEAHVRAGGQVLACCAPPGLVDGRPSDRGAALAQRPHWRQLDATDLPAALLALSHDGFAIARSRKASGNLFHQRRRLDDGELLFLVNTSIEERARGRVSSLARSVEQWDPMTGDVSPYPLRKRSDGGSMRFDLPPCGSLLLFLSDLSTTTPPAADRSFEEEDERELEAAERLSGRTLEGTSPVEARRIEPNVLTLDYVDLLAGGERRRGLYYYEANRLAFAANGLERNPFDSAVQLRDELIGRSFPEESGFEAAYRFVIEEKAPATLDIVIERGDLYTITVNGAPVKADPGRWWLDRAFTRVDIAALARVGENCVTIRASPFTLWHEIEPAYLLGDFTLAPASSGFVLRPPVALQLESHDGRPFYGAGIAYRQRFEIARPGGRYHVRLGAWNGSVARVAVNGRDAGRIAFRPWELDVTGLIRPGENVVEVTVIGTLKNTLGPHHAGKLRGSAWPAAFRQAPRTGPPPGADYDTIVYGLFDPFTLTESRGAAPGP